MPHVRSFPLSAAKGGLTIVCSTLLAGSLMAPAGAALRHQTTTTPATIAPVQAVAQAGSSTNSPSDTSAVSDTVVAAFRNGKIGAVITAYKGPSTTSGIQGVVKNHKNVYGRAVFVVLGEEGDFYKVKLPLRPNGNVGYVKKSDVSTFRNPFRIVISLSEKKLTAYRGSQTLLTTTVAVGKSGAPTPTGEFFTVDLVSTRKKNSPYGPYAIGISGFSNVYQTFGGGDGRIGIHGTNEPAKLGTAVSSGCVRLSNDAITKLAKTLYLGTPVSIQA